MNQTTNGLEEQGTDNDYSNNRMAITGSKLEDEQRQHHIRPLNSSLIPRYSYLRLGFDSNVDTKTKSYQGQNVCEHLDSGMYPRQISE